MTWVDDQMGGLDAAIAATGDDETERPVVAFLAQVTDEALEEGKLTELAVFLERVLQKGRGPRALLAPLSPLSGQRGDAAVDVLRERYAGEVRKRLGLLRWSPTDIDVALTGLV